MSSIVEALYELKYNPFEYGKFLASFYMTISESEENLLLAPLVIPLCSHPIFGQKLASSNRRSTIWTVFDDRTKLYDLQERIDSFQFLTGQCIQYCIVNDWLSINEMELAVLACEGEYQSFSSQKAAVQLGRLFSGHPVRDIYAFLGVNPR